MGKLKKVKDRKAIYDKKIMTNSLQTATSFPSMDLMQNTQVCERLPSPIFNLASAVKMTLYNVVVFVKATELLWQFLPVMTRVNA